MNRSRSEEIGGSSVTEAVWAAMLNPEGTAMYVPPWARAGVDAYFAAGGKLDPALINALVEAVVVEAEERVAGGPA